MLQETCIGKNSCCHYELSDIKTTQDDLIYFPKYFLEDYYIDYFEEKNIPYTIHKKNVYVDSKNITWEDLYIIKTESYSSLNWYPYLEQYTYKSEFIPVTSLEDLKNIDITFPKFIKLDTVSAKDTNHNGIFNSREELLSVFRKSSRILNTLNSKRLTHESHYLFIREPDYFINKEVRCFVYNRRLVAISTDICFNQDQKNILITFINTLIEDIPYYEAIVDVYIYKDDSCKLIEINNYGADSPAGAGNFNWKEDYFLLYGGYDEVVWNIN
jgi:hypothetical protein